VRWLWNHSGVRTLALSILVMNVTFCSAFATWVLYARDKLGLTDAQFGFLISAGAIGALVAHPSTTYSSHGSAV
jgi:hypothetical protein